MITSGLLRRWECKIERAGNPKFYKLLNYRLCVFASGSFMIVI